MVVVELLEPPVTVAMHPVALTEMGFEFVSKRLLTVSPTVVVAGLYVILRPVGRNLALFSAFGRLVHGFMWLVVTLNLFTVLRLLGDAEYTRMLGQEQLRALVVLRLSGSDQYYVGLLFWALAATAVAYLWFKSKYIPGALAVFGVVSSVWCVVCTVVFYISPGFAKVVNLWWFDSPMVIFEIITSFWLLIRGLRPSGVAEGERAEAGAGR